LTRCSRLIRPTVSTVSIPHHPLASQSGYLVSHNKGGQNWTPITPQQGSIFHAETQAWIVRQAESGQTPEALASAAGVCPRTIRKWVKRYREEGPAGLLDRSSRPHRLRQPTPPEVVERIGELRRQRWPGNRIARETGVSPATVSRVLKRLGLSRLRDLEPPPPVHRYERATPGELIHLDTKKLGRFDRVGHRITGDRTRHGSNNNGPGWEIVHVCIDDASRIAFTQIHPDEKAPGAVAFLEAALAYYQSLGVTVTRVMTDNGACYKAHAFRQACKAHGIRHIRTRPYTPKTNGKAERFIQTALREWAYAAAYDTSDQRAAALPAWTHSYNWHRPHGGIQSQTPISRLAMAQDNLLRLHT
jgi:transposase InsO family protein